MRLAIIIIFSLLSAEFVTLFAQTKEALPPTINSAFIETRPLIATSGQRLYFSRRYHPDNLGGKKDEKDIWMADFSKDSLNPTVINLGKNVNSKATDALISINATETEMVVYNNKKFDKAPLILIKKVNNTWSSRQEIVIEDFYNLSPYSDFYYSFEHEVIISALKRADSRGGQDLFASFKNTDGTWTAPQSLGGAVNTRKDDFAPFLAADGKSLFYCSYGLKGEGRSDIYYSYRLDDTWRNWSAPVNIGSHINSANEEIFVSVSSDFKYVYFDSYSPEDTDRNIYRARLSEQFVPKKEDLPIEPSISEVLVAAPPIPEELPTLEPEVQPIQPEPSIVKEEPKEEVQPEPAPVVVKAKAIEMKAAAELPEVISLDGKEKISSNIYFEFNKTAVRGDIRNQLRPIVQMMQADETVMLELEGHADDKGSRETNISISYQRAESVKKHLLREGISPNRIKLTWKGDTEPMASNDDEKDGRELNRRVEIFILK